MNEVKYKKTWYVVRVNCISDPTKYRYMVQGMDRFTLSASIREATMRFNKERIINETRHLIDKFNKYKASQDFYKDFYQDYDLKNLVIEEIEVEHVKTGEEKLTIE